MYILKTEQSFDSAHFLSNYVGKCSNIHGHRWRVVVEVEEKQLIEEGQKKGMVVDFADLKKDIKFEVDKFDHALIIEENSMREETLYNLKKDGFKIVEMKFRTTAENFSKYFFEVIKGKGYKVRRITVYETPSNSAAYEESERV